MYAYMSQRWRQNQKKHIVVEVKKRTKHTSEAVTCKVFLLEMKDMKVLMEGFFLLLGFFSVSNLRRSVFHM